MQDKCVIIYFKQICSMPDKTKFIRYVWDIGWWYDCVHGCGCDGEDLTHYPSVCRRYPEKYLWGNEGWDDRVQRLDKLTVKWMSNPVLKHVRWTHFCLHCCYTTLFDAVMEFSLSKNMKWLEDEYSFHCWLERATLESYVTLQDEFISRNKEWMYDMRRRYPEQWEVYSIPWDMMAFVGTCLVRIYDGDFLEHHALRRNIWMETMNLYFIFPKEREYFETEAGEKELMSLTLQAEQCCRQQVMMKYFC